jgi:Fe(3+) dicitrate transport protein
MQPLPEAMPEPPAAKSVSPEAKPASPETKPASPAEVTVVGSPAARAPGSAHTIKNSDLQRYKYDDPHAVLLQVPGVYVRQEDGVGLRPNIGIRGANPNRSAKVTLMEDGVLFGPAPYSAPAAYYFPLLARMTQIRVLKGPSAIAFGPQTVGGAIDYVTRPVPSSPMGAVDLGVGEYGYVKAHAHAGMSSDRTGFLVEGVHLHNDGFKVLPRGGDTGATRNEWMVKAYHLLDPTSKTTNELRLKLSYSDEASNETYLGLTDADFRKNPYARYAASALDRMTNHRTSIVVDHVVDAAPLGATIKTTFYRHDFARVWRKFNQFGDARAEDVLANPGDPLNQEYLSVAKGEADNLGTGQSILVGPNDRVFVSQGVQSKFDLKRTTGPIRHVIETGIRLHNDSIRRVHGEEAFSMQNGELVPDRSPPAVAISNVTTANKAVSYAVAVHALDAMTWGNLTVTPGLRVEMISSVLDDYLVQRRNNGFVVAVMPGLGVYYALMRELGVLAGVYRGFSPPPPGSRQRPEYSVNYEAGARATSGAFQAEAIGFYNDYSNLTHICTFAESCPDQQVDTQFDAGKARIYGTEVYGRHTPRVGPLKLPLSVAYTFTRGNFESTFETADPTYGLVVRAGDEVPYIPPHQLNLSVGAEHERGAIVAGLNYVAAMREQAGRGPLDQTLATDPQLWLDVGARANVTSRISFYANVRNILGAENIVSHRPFGARPNAPRWVQVGAKFEF